jgi:molybdopterin biosynthesis enzyme
MTGARVPAGANAVQKVELTRENSGFVEILEAVKPGQNISKSGSEIKKGATVFSEGEVVTEEMIAAIASFGYAKLKVCQQPHVKIFSTGNEIVEVSETPQKDQIRNSNSVMLKVLVEKVGGKPEVLPRVGDDFENLKTKIAEAVGISAEVSTREFKLQGAKLRLKKPEILIITGGVSVGDYDFTKPVLRALGAEIFFEKVSLKPGKPTVFARLNDVLIFGLPGNPVSVAVTFQLFVRQAILRMQGAKSCGLKRGYARVSEKIKGTGERDCYLPVSLATNRKGQLVIESLRFGGSSNFIACSRAEALVFVPQGKSLEKGETAEILFL